MANKTLWLPESSATLMTTELNSLADDAFAIASADYANATNKFRWGAFELFVDDWSAAPTAGDFVELHLFYQFDGTNYADGYDGDADADSKPGGNTLHDVFIVSANDFDQRIQVIDIPLLPFDFRSCLYNKAGANFGATGNTLKLFPYNEELQT